MMPTREEIDKAVAFLREIPRTPPDDEMCGTTAWFTLACDWLHCNDPTPLTVDLLRENGFAIDGMFASIRVNHKLLVIDGIDCDVGVWMWRICGIAVVVDLRPTTLGELRQLIRKLEGGKG